MPMWISVYCHKPADDLTAAQLADGIHDADFYTLAEDCGIEAAAVDAALAHLRIEPWERGGLKISFQAEDARPILIHRWTDPDRVAEELAEANERLPDHLPAVRTHFQAVQAVIGIELGYSQLGNIGIILASEIARWLAWVLGGVVETVDETWWAVTRWGEYQPIEPTT